MGGSEYKFYWTAEMALHSVLFSGLIVESWVDGKSVAEKKLRWEQG